MISAGNGPKTGSRRERIKTLLARTWLNSEQVGARVGMTRCSARHALHKMAEAGVLESRPDPEAFSHEVQYRVKQVDA